MNWDEIFRIISGIIISVGGAGAIILAISSFLGKLWAQRYLESVKKDYQKEIENYKIHLDMLKNTVLRYSEQQFDLYYKLWMSLYALKVKADVLWEEANERNIVEFSHQLEKTIYEVEKSYLFIEEEHYDELRNLLGQFSEYQFGKTKLVQLYKQQMGVSPREIALLIELNRIKKGEYENLIAKIRRDLKQQIRMMNPNRET
ncbi:MAG: hypothetical protein ABII89_02335 [Candidatus Omnitrophota bacterium]